MRRILLLTVLALAASAAWADNGFVYVGAGVSKDKLSNIAPSGGLSDLNNTSWKVLAGLRVVSFLGVEADYLSLGSQTSTFLGAGSHSEAKAFTGYAVGFLPLPVPFVDVYGKAGLARWSLSGSTSVPGSLFAFSDHGTNFAWGGGVQVHVGNIGGRLEYERFSIPNTDGARIFSLAVILNLM